MGGTERCPYRSGRERRQVFPVDPARHPSHPSGRSLPAAGFAPWRPALFPASSSSSSWIAPEKRFGSQSRDTAASVRGGLGRPLPIRGSTFPATQNRASVLGLRRSFIPSTRRKSFRLSNGAEVGAGREPTLSAPTSWQAAPARTGERGGVSSACQRDVQCRSPASCALSQRATCVWMPPRIRRSKAYAASMGSCVCRQRISFLTPLTSVFNRVQMRQGEGYPETKMSFYRLTEAERVALTENAINERSTVLERWVHLDSHEAELSSGRAALAAEFLEASDSVVDLGCGTMTLERYLRPGVRYFPVDVCARDARTLVCDFNVEPVPTTSASAAACLGLLEYLFDAPAFMRALRDLYATCAVSYCVSDAPEPLLPRMAHAWVHDFDCASLEKSFENAGWTVERSQAVDKVQMLWRLTRRQ